MAGGDSLDEWFRCPMCGDGGEVVQAKVGSNVSVKFKCESREHRLSNKRFSRFSRDEWRRSANGFGQPELDEPQESVLAQALQFESTYPKLNSLRPCIECPECGSDNTDGALERVIVGSRPDRELLGVTTVWCYDCAATAHSWIRTDQRFSKETVRENVNYPPEYL